MKTLKLTLAVLVATATSTLVVNAAPSAILSPRAAQAQPTVVSGASGERDYVHDAQAVGSPRSLAHAGDFRTATGFIPVYVRPVATSAGSPRAVETFPWLKDDQGTHVTSAKKGECKMSCCSAASVCAMPCCKS